MRGMAAVLVLGMVATTACERRADVPPAQPMEGEAEMAVNYSLQPWEIEAGFTLACQTRPTSQRLVLDFDAA